MDKLGPLNFWQYATVHHTSTSSTKHKMKKYKSGISFILTFKSVALYKQQSTHIFQTFSL